MSVRVVVAGSFNTDKILQTPQIPSPGETILGGQFSMAAGGKGANQAVAAARSGSKVTFLARVGDDLFGRQAIENFQRAHINVEHVIKDDRASTGVALIFVDEKGENCIGVAAGANDRLSPADIDQAHACIESANLLVLQLEIPLETVCRAAKIAAAANVPVILNPAPAQALNRDLLQNVSILTPNESEAELLTGIRVTHSSSAAQAAEMLQSRGVETVIVTMGAQGVLVASPQFSGWVPAFAVDPVDTTAAGDVFNGALAVALSEGQPLATAVRFANAAAALSVMQLGAQPSAPHRQQIEDFLLQQ
jgi:ribokinase